MTKPQPPAPSPSRPGILEPGEALATPGATDGLVFQSRRQAEALDAWAAAHPAKGPSDPLER